MSFTELLTGEAGPSPLAASTAFARFRSTWDARCDNPPVLTEFTHVGGYQAAMTQDAPAPGRRVTP